MGKRDVGTISQFCARVCCNIRYLRYIFYPGEPGYRRNFCARQHPAVRYGKVSNWPSFAAPSIAPTPTYVVGPHHTFWPVNHRMSVCPGSPCHISLAVPGLEVLSPYYPESPYTLSVIPAILFDIGATCLQTCPALHFISIESSGDLLLPLSSDKKFLLALPQSPARNSLHRHASQTCHT